MRNNFDDLLKIFLSVPAQKPLSLHAFVDAIMASFANLIKNLRSQPFFLIFKAHFLITLQKT